MQEITPDPSELDNTSALKFFDSLSSESLSFNSSDYVMYKLDCKSGEYIFMSPSIKSLTGYSRRELNERGFKSIVKEISSQRQNRYKLKGGKETDAEEFYAKYLIQTKAGEFKWIEDNSFTYLDESGERTTTEGILRDASALQSFVDDLNDEKNNLDRIFDLSNTILIQLDKNLTIVMINKRGSIVLGGTKQEIIGMNLEAFIPERSKNKFNDFVDELLAEKKLDTIYSEGQIRSLENKIETIEWHNTLIRDKKGELVSIIAAGHEITERRKEEKIRNIISEILEEANSEKNLDEFFNFIHESIGRLMKAENFYIAYYNREEDLLTFPYFVDKHEKDASPQKLGKGLTESVLMTGRSKLVDRELDDKLIKSEEVDLIGPQAEIWLGVPLKIQDKSIGVMVVQDYEEVTTYGETEQQILDVVAYPISRAIERKIVEAEREELIVQLKELNESKDRLFSLISHDLRNPFNSLLGFAEILTTEYDVLTREEIREYLNVINDSSQNLYGMTNNLLHYSRYQLGKYTYNPIEKNVKETIEGILEAQKNHIKKKDILFINAIDEEISFYADENMLNVVLNNIIGNAIKFSAPGGSISIKTEKFSDEDDKKIRLILKDSGTGISEENMERIEKKEMFSNPGTMREFGTGLGLFLSRDFTSMNKGELEIESEDGVGTTVLLTLPSAELQTS
ncbi:MAG: PAS domain S-box protein [Ignavibacterium sp.]|nr:MAG: PAS domain S-box protein [Ignavibacterium sp.]